MQTIGQTIKQHREANRLTQKALADMLNVSPQAVSKWENDRSLPDTALIVPLARVLHISADKLLSAGEATESQL